MITYLVSLETREISYLFDMNKYHIGEDTPRHISVEIHLNTSADNFLETHCMLSGLRQIFKTPGKSISCTDIFTNLVDKNFFHRGRFSKAPASVAIANHDD